MKYLRPNARALLLKVAAGERIPPEFVRIALSGCLKVAVLKALTPGKQSNHGRLHLR